MINLRELERLGLAGAHEMLLMRLCPHDWGHTQDLRQELRAAGCLAPAALGLALSRACELTYASSSTATRLAERLLGHEHEHGGFGGRPDRAGANSIATAIALAGLLAFRDLRQFLPRASGSSGCTNALPGDLAQRINFAAERAVGALGRATSAALDPFTASIILWQLAHRRNLARGIDFARLRRIVSRAPDHHGRLDPLTRIALAAA